MPSYTGSDDYVVTPVPAVQGRVHGFEISPRPGGVAIDLIPDGKRRIGFDLGPVATYSGSRHSRIKDAVVRRAGKLDTDIEVGFTAGVTAHRLLNPYDSLTAGVDVTWDVTGPRGGTVVMPQVVYITPLSRAALVSFIVNAKHASGEYADYRFGVSPQQSLTSGLPEFQAHAGWTKVEATIVAGYDLNGDLLDGGFALFALGSYGRMVGDARATPYTSIRGSANQWILGAGVGYTF
jgi:outer membrane scaffolding protein for murein synthesis (MipA/OmpV family)